MFFDQLMHFFIRRDFSPYRFLLSLLDETKRAPLFLKKPQTALTELLFRECPF